MRRLAVAIDGPVGSGKSTVARMVASQLGYTHIDTGALYRAIALLATRRGVPYADHEALGRLARDAQLEFRRVDGCQRIFLNGEDVEDDIRTPDMSQGASIVSAVTQVREALLDRQRQMADAGGVVMEGRDIGTVVLPNADVKVFLTASSEERARRRALELQQRGNPVSYEDVLAELLLRDERDSQRKVAPLKPAADAVTIDTTGLTLGQVVDAVLSLVQERAGCS